MATPAVPPLTGPPAAGRARPWAMGAWLTRRWLRRRWIALVPLTLVVAAGTAGTGIAFAAAHRTSNAYGDYLRRADVGDLVINPSLSTREVDDLIRSLPNVTRVTSDAMFSVTNDDGAPRARVAIDEGSGPMVLVRGSSDGRYTEMDRPVVQRGRMPSGTDELALTVDAERTTGYSIGDIVTLAFWQSVATTPLETASDATRAYLTEVVSPIGVEHLTVVGVVTMPDEVLPDPLYPRATAIVSPDIAARYDCLPPTPPPGGTMAELMDALLPANCATQYRYYSLSMAHGAADVKPALDQFVRAATPMNERMRSLSDAADYDPDLLPAYFLIPTETAQGVRQVERAVRPTVTALLVLGGSLAAVTVLLAALAAARELRRTRLDQRQWYQLGVGSVTRAAVAAFPPLVATVAGVAVGLGVAWLFGAGPVGLVQVVEPRPARRLDVLASLAELAIVATIVAAIAVLTARAARRPEDAPPATRQLRSRTVRVGSPAIAIGLRSAYWQRSSSPVLASGVVLTGVFVAATVFGLSLASLVSTPRSYGWPWDVAAMTGAGYGDLDLDAATEAFSTDPAVASWTVLGFSSQVSLNGEPMTAMFSLDRISDLDLTVRAGRLPVADDEVAVGQKTAADLGLHVGDTVDVGEGDALARTATISGIVVFPSLGPLQSDRVGTGSGVLVPQAVFEWASEHASTTQSIEGIATFVGIDLAPAADTPATRARLRVILDSLDTLGAPPNVYEHPLRPPEIVDASAIRRVPLAVGAAFAAAAAGGLVFVTWASVRSRRREVAVLRTLGFSNAQVRRSVRTFAVATMGASLLIGVPLGVIAGRVLWRGFADELGVLIDPPDLWWAVAATVAGGVALAIAASWVPGRLAASAVPADGLRAE